jgi:hypothetical protein
MAITTTTIEIADGAVGWARSDVIIGIQTALTLLGVLDSQSDSGIVTGVTSRTGGGSLNSSTAFLTYYPETSTSTTGIGTGATFRVRRNNRTIYDVFVVNPGYGYTNGEVVRVSSEDIGGSVNGATDLDLTITNYEATSYGSSTTYYDYDYSGNHPWGVARYVVNPNKKYGKTYFGFQTYSNTGLFFHAGSAFFPYGETINTNDGGYYYNNRFSGTPGLDVSFASDAIQNQYDKNSVTYTRYASKLSQVSYNGLQFASGNAYKLDLNIFRSGIDPNFAVLSFKQPTLSSGKLRDNTYLTFFIHNYESSLWDLDYVFLEGITYITPSTNENDPYLLFRTLVGGNAYYSPANAHTAHRAAENGYLGTNNNNNVFMDSYYRSMSYDGQGNFYSERPRIYRRTSADGIDSSQNFNGVIKGIPLNLQMIPSPYYLPDDFVLIDFRYEAPAANIQQGDTVTISGSEVYTVIQGSYNQSGVTRGILFCARSV